MIDGFRLPDFVFCVGVDQTSPSIFHAASEMYSNALTVANSKIQSEAVPTAQSISSQISRETLAKVDAAAPLWMDKPKITTEGKKEHVNVKVHKADLKHQMSWAQILHIKYVPLQAKFLQKRQYIREDWRLLASSVFLWCLKT